MRFVALPPCFGRQLWPRLAIVFKGCREVSRPPDSPVPPRAHTMKLHGKFCKFSHQRLAANVSSSSGRSLWTSLDSLFFGSAPHVIKTQANGHHMRCRPQQTYIREDAARKDGGMVLQRVHPDMFDILAQARQWQAALRPALRHGGTYEQTVFL